MRLRMEWDWVCGYPLFIYTTWICKRKFNVKIVKGIKGKQNAGYTGPHAPAWKQYIQEGFLSQAEVVQEAMKKSKAWIELEGSAV